MMTNAVSGRLKRLPEISRNNALLAQNRNNYRRGIGVKRIIKTDRYGWLANRHGVQVVGGSNPYAPTNFPLLISRLEIFSLVCLPV